MHEHPGARRSRAAARGHGCDLGQAALLRVQVRGHTVLAPCNPFATLHGVAKHECCADKQPAPWLLGRGQRPGDIPALPHAAGQGLGTRLG